MKPSFDLPEGARLIDLDTSSDAPAVVFLCRDTGSWDAVLPVIDAVASARAFHPFAMASGVTLESLERDGPRAKRRFHGSFDGGSLERRPALFVNAGGVSDHHLEFAARAGFPDVPMLSVEEDYGRYARLFTALKGRGLPLPDKVCCIDAESRSDLLETFPELKGKAVVTGQPAFDRIYPVGGTDRRTELRRAIGVDPSASLVTVVGTTKVLDLVEALTRALGARDCRRPVFAFRQHPRDPTFAGLHLDAFDRAGLQVAETGSAPHETVTAASDLVVSTWSTDLIHAICRGIPAMYVVDRRYVSPDAEARFPLPPVRLGAALHCDTVEDAAHLIQLLADPDHHGASLDLGDRIRRNQARHYPPGRDAARAVAAQIRSFARV